MLWFKVGDLMLVAQKGVGALQRHRVMFGETSGADSRTTWSMCHRWRSAMQGDVLPLPGAVEVDEPFVGGNDKNRHISKRIGITGGLGKGAVIVRWLEKAWS